MTSPFSIGSTSPSSPLSLPQILQTEIVGSYSSLAPVEIGFKRSDRQVQLPDEGLVLPTSVELPSMNNSRADLLQNAVSLGLAIPKSYTKAKIIDRVKEFLNQTGYQSIDQVHFTRKAPIKLKYLSDLIDRGKVSLPSTIYLDQINTNDLFDYINSKREVKPFLIEQGYREVGPNILVRDRPLDLVGGKDYPSLTTNQEYVKFIVSPIILEITQEDLSTLNQTYESIFRSIPDRYWPSFDRLTKDVSGSLDIPKELANLLLLLGQLEKKKHRDYLEIMSMLKDNANYRKDEDRIRKIRQLIRDKLRLIPRIYPKGKTSLTVSDEVESILDYKTVPSNHRKFFQELLSEYPEIDPVIREIDLDERTPALDLIKVFYQEEPSAVQLLYSYAVNYPLSFNESPKTKERRARIDLLPKSYLDALYQIYDTNNLNEILEQDEHPLELYLSAIRQTSTKDLPSLALRFGMSIPGQLVGPQVRNYVLQRIAEYQNVITRKEPVPGIQEQLSDIPDTYFGLIERLSIYTDSEIINFFGFSGAYENRDDLIANIYRQFTESGFGLVDKITQAALNSETLMLTEVKDLMKPYLIFGNIFKYRVHEIDELIQAWSVGDGFKKVAETGYYTSSQVIHLREVLQRMKEINPDLTVSVDQLSDLIKVELIKGYQRTSLIDDFKRHLLRSAQRTLAKHIFYKIFYAGMYMRRWKGPGNSYPSKTIATLGSEDPEPKSILILGELSGLLDQLRNENPNLMNDFQNLPIIEHSAKMIIKLEKLYNQLVQIINGKSCIRIGSSYLIESAYYYLGVIFEEIIPEFDPAMLDSIS